MPGGEENDEQIGLDGGVFLVPYFELTFIWGDKFPVVGVRLQMSLGNQFFFVAENDGADASDAGLDVVDGFLDTFRIGLVIPEYLWSWADNAHVADQNIDHLRQFIYFGHPQIFADEGYPRVISQSQRPGEHVRAVF